MLNEKNNSPSVDKSINAESRGGEVPVRHLEQDGGASFGAQSGGAELGEAAKGDRAGGQEEEDVSEEGELEE